MPPQRAAHQLVPPHVPPRCRREPAGVLHNQRTSFHLLSAFVLPPTAFLLAPCDAVPFLPPRCRRQPAAVHHQRARALRGRRVQPRPALCLRVHTGARQRLHGGRAGAGGVCDQQPAGGAAQGEPFHRVFVGMLGLSPIVGVHDLRSPLQPPEPRNSRDRALLHLPLSHHHCHAHTPQALSLRRLALYFDTSTDFWEPGTPWRGMEPGQWDEWFQAGITLGQQRAGTAKAREYVLQVGRCCTACTV